MNKLFIIALKDIREIFKDRNLLLIMFAAPLTLATIIAFAFSGLGGGNAPVRDIPVAVVNLDKGATGNNFGQIYVDALVPKLNADGTIAQQGTDTPVCDRNAGEKVEETPSTNTLYDLTDAVELKDPAAARAGVDDGTYAAAIIIPEDFSANVSYSPTNTEIKSVAVEVYANGSRPISASVIRSVTESITNQIATGNIALAATLDTLIGKITRAASNNDFVTLLSVFAGNNGNPFTIMNSEGFGEAVLCAFSSSSTPVNIARQTIEGEAVTFNPLVVIGAAQAIFFALFTANGGASGIIEERRNWTLQRLLVTPTPRYAILLGKLLGVFFMILLQLVFLFIGFTLVGSMLEGQINFIWGTNFVAIAVILLATSLAAAGLGSIVAAAAKTPEQANTIGSVLSMAMGALGGSFGFSIAAAVPSLSWLSYLSIVHWGTDAFTRLAANDSAIWTNALVLAIFGAVTFSIAMMIFNRRLEDK